MPTHPELTGVALLDWSAKPVFGIRHQNGVRCAKENRLAPPSTFGGLEQPRVFDENCGLAGQVERIHARFVKGIFVRALPKTATVLFVGGQKMATLCNLSVAGAAPFT